MKVSYDKARKILMEADYGILSTTCDDGLPYGVPLNYALTGLSIYFHCAPDGMKMDNILRDGRACLTVVLREKNLGNRLTTAYESAMAFGVVRPAYAEDERQAAFRLLAGKYAPDMPEQALSAYIKKHGPDAAVLRMDVEYITGKAGYPEEL